MSTPHELKVSLFRHEDGTYFVSLQYADPDDAAERLPVHGTASFPVEKLLTLTQDPVAHGRLLSESLFADPRVRQEFETACAVTDNESVDLRFRLQIDRTATDLHGLLWETLSNPRSVGAAALPGEKTDADQRRWLATNPHIFFSRFLGSPGWRSVRLRRKGDLRALVVISNPQNLTKHSVERSAGPQDLTEVLVDKERALAQKALAGVVCDWLVSDPAHPGRTTLDKIIGLLDQASGFDLLYLVCHGALPGKGAGRRPILYLEGEDGNVAQVSGVELADWLHDLGRAPPVVVLASCQSSGDGRTLDEGALAALGPRLCEAGVPAVLAMQGNVTADTAGEFLETFFRELVDHGQVDRAATRGRAAVRGRPDDWMPVLFTRLRGGTIWYIPKLHGGPAASEFERWPAVLERIYAGECVPIVGFGLLDFVVKSSREVARHLAEMFRFPLAPSDQEDLSRVAQFLRIQQGDEKFVGRRLQGHLKNQILTRRALLLAADAAETEIDDLDQLIDRVGQRRQQDADDPHRVLARLPCPVYVTTTPDRFLTHALEAAGKKPQVVPCAWARGTTPPPGPDPTVDAPLVCHLFGDFSKLDSLILTEDDGFDYLVNFSTRRDKVIPGEVLEALVKSALLFVGFEVDDWPFRVLFRSLKELPGAHRGRPNVAVQVTPEDRLLEPDRARSYLEEYYRLTELAVYWGTAQEFFKSLRAKWLVQYGKKYPL